MGFRPAVDRIVAQCPRDRQTLFFSATLAGEVGTVGQALHARRAPPRAHPDRHPARPRSSTASSPSSATSASTRCSASCAASATSRWSSCAPSAASTGWSSASAARASTSSGCTATSPRASASAPWQASRLRRRHPRGHRCGRARHRRRGDLARHQLRSARRPRRLRAPHRAHRPRRAHRRRRDLRRRRAGADVAAHRGRARPRPRARGQRAEPPTAGGRRPLAAAPALASAVRSGRRDHGRGARSATTANAMAARTKHAPTLHAR